MALKSGVNWRCVGNETMETPHRHKFVSSPTKKKEVMKAALFFLLIALCNAQSTLRVGLLLVNDSVVEKDIAQQV